jgi:hypothetical protein
MYQHEAIVPATPGPGNIRQSSKVDGTWCATYHDRVAALLGRDSPSSCSARVLLLILNPPLCPRYGALETIACDSESFGECPLVVVDVERLSASLATPTGVFEDSLLSRNSKPVRCRGSEFSSGLDPVGQTAPFRVAVGASAVTMQRPV